MFSLVKLITFADGLCEQRRSELLQDLRARAQSVPEIQNALVEPTLAGVYNGGDIIWRAHFDDKAACDSALNHPAWRDGVAALLADSGKVASVQSAAYAPLRAGGRSPGKGVYRVALFCANRNPTADRLARWAAETADMAKHVKSIRSWQLGKVVEANGSRPWTHVWEQEYETLEGLTGAYMMHPCHWAQVDRWFDPEFPEWLVDPELCHTFCATSRPVIVSVSAAA